MRLRNRGVVKYLEEIPACHPSRRRQGNRPIPAQARADAARRQRFAFAHSPRRPFELPALTQVQLRYVELQIAPAHHSIARAVRVALLARHPQQRLAWLVSTAEHARIRRRLPVRSQRRGDAQRRPRVLDHAGAVLVQHPALRRLPAEHAYDPVPLRHLLIPELNRPVRRQPHLEEIAPQWRIPFVVFHVPLRIPRHHKLLRRGADPSRTLSQRIEVPQRRDHPHPPRQRLRVQRRAHPPHRPLGPRSEPVKDIGLGRSETQTAAIVHPQLRPLLPRERKRKRQLHRRAAVSPPHPRRRSVRLAPRVQLPRCRSRRRVPVTLRQEAQPFVIQIEVVRRILDERTRRYRRHRPRQNRSRHRQQPHSHRWRNHNTQVDSRSRPPISAPPVSPPEPRAASFVPELHRQP